MYTPKWRQIMREHSPGAAGSEQVEHGVEQFSLWVFGRSALWLDFGKKRLNLCPLLICQVGCISLPVFSVGVHTSYLTLFALFWTPSERSEESRLLRTMLLIPSSYIFAWHLVLTSM